jgi:hypothetical protein
MENKKTKKDRPLTEKELLQAEERIADLIPDGILSNIYGMVELKKENLELIKRLLKKYPINFVEYADSILKVKDYKKLFQTAVDKNFDSLARDMINKKYENIERDIYKANYGTVFNSGSYNAELEAGQVFRQEFTDGWISLCDNKEYENELKSHEIYGEEYFNELLEKGNIKLAIIELCKKLEAKLKLKYQEPDGTFGELLKKYCSEFNVYDDEDNSYDPHTPELLNKLRIVRNNITHSGGQNTELTSDEIRYCVQHICRN